MAHENYINHIAFVLDESASMSYRKNELIKVADEQIRYLAQRSKEVDQETRATVYTFSDRIRCVFYDKDVLRLPSLRSHYNPNGMTALIDATLKSQDDLALTPEIYGDHAFLTFVLTDGAENVSRTKPSTLQARLERLPSHWTVAVLVPDQASKWEAKKFGFPADNIAIWDTTSKIGLENAVGTIRTATDNFMTMRSQGVRGSRSIFSTDITAVNATTVAQAGLRALEPSAFTISLVQPSDPVEIRSYVQGRLLRHYQTGRAYYQLTKTETIQEKKQLAVFDKKTGKVYIGQQARDLVGLPNEAARVKPNYNPDYDIFVQSTSVNRKLVPGTKLLVLN